MADNFGDDAGQQFYDWAIRIGFEAVRRSGFVAGQRELRATVRRLEGALGNAGDAARPLSYAADDIRDLLPEFSKLDLRELRPLDGFDEIKSAVDSGLSADGAWHGFIDEGDKTWLVFRTADAAEVADSFDRLASVAREAGSRAEEEVRLVGEGRDSEPLEDRAARAREAADAEHDAAERERPRVAHREETRAK